jgi:hypothetical protein
VEREDERIRALLAKAGDLPGPPLGLTSAAVVRRGRRIRRLRWGVSIAGVFVVSAGFAVSMLLAPARPVQPASQLTTQLTTVNVTPTGTTTTTVVTTTSTYIGTTTRSGGTPTG